MNDCREKEINTPPSEAGLNQEMFHVMPSSQYKRKLNSDLGKLVLWDTSSLSSLSAGFPNKVTIPCPNNLSLGLLACNVASRISLDSVTICKVASSSSVLLFFFFKHFPHLALHCLVLIFLSTFFFLLSGTASHVSKLSSASNRIKADQGGFKVNANAS